MELNSNLIYKLSSIQVKNLTTGEALSANSYSYSYNEEENSLTFTLPDSTPIKIEYKATVNLSNGSTMNQSNSGNRFTVYGNSGNEINNSNASLSGEFNPNVTIQGEGAELSIVKYDLDDVEKKLPGAEFSLVEATYDSDNNKIIESKSADDVKKGTTNAQGRLTFKNVRIDQIYVLKETKAPDGYEKVNDIYFVYPGNSFNDLKKPEANNEKYKLLQFSNKSMEYPIGDRKTTQETGKLTFTKSFSGVNENQVSGISFTVKNIDSNKVIGTYGLEHMKNTDGSYSKKLENLPVGEYTVTENNADVAGYTVVTAYKVNEKDSENGTVEVVKDTANTVDVTNTYTKLVSYTVKKVWNDGGVANVVFPESLDVTLTANGEKVAEREDATYVLNASNEWSYTWNELPENDANGNKINYSVVEADIDGFNSKNDLTIDEITGAGYITLTNTYSEGKTIEISKIDVGGNEIGGAILTLTDKNGEVISKWTSVVSENHKVTVKPGTYTLHEDLSPVGYKVAKDISFDVDIEDKVTVNGKKVDQVVMVDEDQTYDIAISKQDITNNKDLPGAKLSLKDTKTNKVVETWTSASEAHVVTVVPSTYELSEVAAPNGYEIAEKITFTVERDGTITIDGKKVETVIMQDQPTKPTVDTSDHNNIVFYGFAGVISLGMALMMLLTRKKIH